MQHNQVLRKFNFNLLTPRGGLRGMWAYICYHAAAFVIPFKFDMQRDHVLKKLNFDLLTPPPDREEGDFGRVYACKIFATMLLHASFPLI